MEYDDEKEYDADEKFYTSGPARLPHGKDDDSRLEKFLLPVIPTLSVGKPAYDLLQNCVANLQLAWAGRRVETRAIRLGLIRRAPVDEIKREIDVSRTAVDQQDRVMKEEIERSIFVPPIERLSRPRLEVLLAHAVDGGADRGMDGKQLFGRLAKPSQIMPASIRLEFDAIIQCAWQGRTPRTKAIRLGIIAGVPVREIANKVDLPFARRKHGRPRRRCTQHVYQQYAMMKKIIPERSIITCAAARWKIYQEK